MAQAIRTLTWDMFRSVGDAGVQVGRIIDHSPSGVHDHVFHEIVYVESGTAEHITAAPGSLGTPGGPAARRLHPGDLIVIRPQVWHGYNRPRNLTIINCLFDKRVTQRFASLLARVEGTLELFRMPCRRRDREAPVVLHVPPAQRPALLERLERMMAEERQRTNGWQAAVTAALLEILIATARLSRQRRHDPPARLSDVTDRAVLDTVTHLEAHYAKPIRLDDLAQRAGVSPAHLSRNFSKRMGMGIVEFVHHLRCEEACRLLRGSDQPITRIGTGVGYVEVAYFSRCFRRQTGQSPRDYRKIVP